jgi:hypothetical protein
MVIWSVPVCGDSKVVQSNPLGWLFAEVQSVEVVNWSNPACWDDKLAVKSAGMVNWSGTVQSAEIVNWSNPIHWDGKLAQSNLTNLLLRWI